MSDVLLLHPGAMGASLGRALVDNGHQVRWISQHRSKETAERAKNAGLLDSKDLNVALENCDIVLSVCPPEYAVDVAKSVFATGFSGLFCDANAIAPSTAEWQLEHFQERYIDGGIVGPPAYRPGTTRLYLSGAQANAVFALFDGSEVDARIVEGNPLSASAVKMCYAAYTKGTSALLLALRSLANSYGVTEDLKEEWDISQKGLWERSERTGPGTSGKAWRFAPEMLEIAKTLEDSSLPGGFHRAAAEIYERMADLKNAGPTPTEEVVELLLSEGNT